ncbi:hypothetical protein NCAS_0A11050 [Naumovozyma castellii]|uniref:Pre-mRNA-splicing factor BRR1 n=1 Tax=Naumovozyma castellii TaxID=27288 RepID=G0V865_NAUCA|nr:hypothetical protein NCAS_0A11050 [Naumovozyma castellii CBS 4309]CCC67663.1 hypothetical protein NCAS_0A11050 [Naumovozyma castellii CBS 4309]
MAKKGQNENLTERQAVNPLFGQAPAFAVQNSLVDPAVVRYLQDVRKEALRTTVVSIKPQKRARPVVTASMYDDDDDELPTLTARKKGRNSAYEFPDQLIYFDRNMNDWIKWFECTKNIVQEKAYEFTGYDDNTLNILLCQLKQYMETKSKDEDKLSSLIGIISDECIETTDSSDHSLEIDETWAETMCEKLQSRAIKNISEIKDCVLETPMEPYGFKAWYKYLISNVPVHTCFVTMINDRNVWILIQYFQQGLLEEIYKRGKNASVLEEWLLEIMIHLPVNITAEYTSTLRDLGKKCQVLIKRQIESSSAKTLLRLPKELEELDIKAPQQNVSIFELVLSIIAKIYGQRDLIDWKSTLI